MSKSPIDAVDRDGAIRETQEVVAGHTRAVFFRKAAVGGGAVLGSSAILGMLPQVAGAHGGPDHRHHHGHGHHHRGSRKLDLSILNYALTLEYLEAAFYAEAIDGGALSGDVADFATLVGAHEATHVQALISTIQSLGGTPVAEPTFDFMGTTQDQSTFIATSFVLENTGVHAYLGQATRLKNKDLLAAAASIVTVEARHASAAAILLGNDPYADKTDGSITPDGAFDTPLTMEQVLAAVGDTGFITG